MPPKQVRRERVRQRRRQHRLRRVPGVKRGDAAKGEGGEESHLRVPVPELVQPQTVDDVVPIPVLYEVCVPAPRRYWGREREGYVP